MMFRKVRNQVLARTNAVQGPFTYGRGQDRSAISSRPDSCRPGFYRHERAHEFDGVVGTEVQVETSPLYLDWSRPLGHPDRRWAFPRGD